MPISPDRHQTPPPIGTVTLSIRRLRSLQWPHPNHPPLVQTFPKAKSLVFSHISRQMDVPGVPERIVKEVAAIHAGNVFWGQDLMEIPAGSTALAKPD